jgi:hypothetical protein
LSNVSNNSPKDYLAKDEQFAGLVARLDSLAPIQRVLEETLPPNLAQQTRAVSLSRGELTLVVATAAAATDLKPRLAALMLKLESRLAKKSGNLERSSLSKITPQTANGLSATAGKQQKITLNDFVITEIRVEVQVNNSPMTEAFKRKLAAPPLPEPPWAQLANQMDDSPLKEALISLAKQRARNP